MRTRVLILFLSSLLFGLLSCARDQPATAEQATTAAPAVKPSNPHIAELVADYDRYFTQAMQQNGSPGAAVVIVKDSTIVFCKGYGVKQVGKPDTVDAHTVFRIGSLSKGFAAVLTGVLVEEERLDWNDPVLCYYPEFSLCDSEQTKRILLTHILSHTTGLPYHTFTNLIETGEDARDIDARFPTVKLFGKEGELFCYQNAAFNVIEEVMLSATGENYADLITHKIFQPAGMNRASATYLDLMSCTDRAMPHDPTGNGWASTPITPFYYNTPAAGGVNASIADMGEWLKVLLGHKPEVIQNSTLDSIFYPRIKTHNERRYFREWPGDKEAYYGLGWRILKTGNESIVYHGGYVNGFKGEIALSREHGVAICVLFNGAPPLAASCIPTFFEKYNFYRSAIEQWQI